MSVSNAVHRFEAMDADHHLPQHLQFTLSKDSLPDAEMDDPTDNEDGPMVSVDPLQDCLPASRNKDMRAPVHWRGGGGGSRLLAPACTSAHVGGRGTLVWEPSRDGACGVEGGGGTTCAWPVGARAGGGGGVRGWLRACGVGTSKWSEGRALSRRHRSPQGPAFASSGRGVM